MTYINILRKVWSAIMNIFKVDGNLSIDTSNVYVNGEKADLSVCNISYADYSKLVVDGKCESNVIYVVSSDYVNAYGQQIKNLAAPTELNDAATKEYVDAQISSVNGITRDEAAQIAKEVFKSSLSSILNVI